MNHLPNDYVRCLGNGDSQCSDCRRREPSASIYTPNMLPAQRGSYCQHRIYPLWEVALVDWCDEQGRGD